MDVWVKRKRARSNDDFETWSGGGPCPTLNAMDNTTETYATVLITFSHTQGFDVQPSTEVTPTLRAGGGGLAVMIEHKVRRLTPVECERLQGFPDDWTGQHPDSVRYRQCGNAVAVPVVEWIVRRMVQQ